MVDFTFWITLRILENGKYKSQLSAPVWVLQLTVLGQTPHREPLHSLQHHPYQTGIYPMPKQSHGVVGHLKGMANVRKSSIVQLHLHALFGFVCPRASSAATRRGDEFGLGTT